jgi:hypothetical protein
MAAAFGVRLVQCGPNQLAVLAKVRPLLTWPPSEVKAAALRDVPLVVAIDVERSTAETLVAELKQLGAMAEVFVSTPCPVV